MSTRKNLGPLSGVKLEMVARLFGVLSEPSRLALLQALFDGPLTVSQLMNACGMKQANVSKQLGVLHDHRLVKRERDGASVRYEIADPMIFALCNLVCGKMERDVRCDVELFQVEI
jgi:DNA-binding transcriptional ArsR family regulator